MIYHVSVDIEADGPIPSKNNLMSIGAVSLDASYKPVSTFSVNLLPRKDHPSDPATMEWWQKQPEAYAEATRDMVPPKEGMEKFVQWLNQHKPQSDPKQFVFVGYPVTYDFMWVYDYFITYLGSSPFSFPGLDIKTLISIATKKLFCEVNKSDLPKQWRKEWPKHTHKAVDDAIEQATIFRQLMEYFEGRREW